MKYKVYFSAYDNDDWRHRDGIEIVEANSADEAKEIIKNKSDYFEEYFVDKVEELKMTIEEIIQMKSDNKEIIDKMLELGFEERFNIHHLKYSKDIGSDSEYGVLVWYNGYFRFETLSSFEGEKEVNKFNIMFGIAKSIVKSLNGVWEEDHEKLNCIDLE